MRQVLVSGETEISDRDTSIHRIDRQHTTCEHLYRDSGILISEMNDKSCQHFFHIYCEIAIYARKLKTNKKLFSGTVI